MTIKAVAIFVLETEEQMPARALLGMADVEEGDEADLRPSDVEMDTMAVWSADVGAWTVAGVPVDSQLNEMISAHAASLGVPGFE